MRRITFTWLSSLYNPFNTFEESKGNEWSYYCYLLHWGVKIQTPFFVKYTEYSKTSKTHDIPPNSLLYLRKYVINQNKKCIFMMQIKNDWNFYDQNLHTFYKKLKIFILFFFNFHSFLKIFFNIIFHSAAAFRRWINSRTLVELVEFSIQPATQVEKIYGPL